MDKEDLKQIVAAILSAGVLARGERFDINNVQDQALELMNAMPSRSLAYAWAYDILKDWGPEIGIPAGASLRETFPLKMAELLNKHEMLEGEVSSLREENSRLEDQVSKMRASDV